MLVVTAIIGQGVATYKPDTLGRYVHQVHLSSAVWKKEGDTPRYIFTLKTGDWCVGDLPRKELGEENLMHL